MVHYASYNPLDKKNLGASVADALLEGRIHPLGEIEKFKGAGIYAIYYTGHFPAYQPLVEHNQHNPFSAPIYVGKAVPSGARKGGFGLDMTPGAALFNRLAEHAESVRCAENLNIEDFSCRFLVVDDIWIPLGESLLISRFTPVWNSVLDGFGNHDPGSGRYGGLRPVWDVLHPGRTWAEKCAQRAETADELARRVFEHLYTKAAVLHPAFHEGVDS